MNHRILIVPFLLAGLTGAAGHLHAAESSGRSGIVLPYAIVNPTVRAARVFQKRGDYATAVLIYEAVLEQNPSDPQALRSMVDCHEALARKEKPEPPEVVQKAKTGDDENLYDLPDLIPADKAATRQQARNPADPLL
jgi:lipopolysaccharide biosynthesis regulator YciM